MNRVSLLSRVLQPTLKVLRLTDGKTGATLGKVHGLCVGPDALYMNEIVGMDDETREKVHLLYTKKPQGGYPQGCSAG